MDNLTIGVISRIATNTRCWVEGEAVRLALAYLDSDILEDGLIDSDSLSGMCAIASAELFRRLRTAGYDPLIGYCETGSACHCFVIYRNNIVDVTATQFQKYKDKKVVIVKVHDSNPWYHKATSIFDNISSLRQWQIKRGWPSGQTIPETQEIAALLKPR